MKLMGSKSRIAKYIVPIIQKCINDNHITSYYEPFVGGANVIDKIHCNKKYGNDLNKYLIALLEYVANDGKLLDEVPRELYSEVRANYKSEKYEDWYVGNIGFLASYNGRWFDGGYAKAGYEHTKNGDRYRDYYQEAKRNLEEQAKYLTNIFFTSTDYRNLSFTKGSLIYVDPPYVDTDAVYNEKGDWDNESASELYDYCDRLTENNVKWALSSVLENKGKVNSQLENWLSLHDEYNVYSFDGFTYTACGKGNSHAKEILITNYLKEN